MFFLVVLIWSSWRGGSVLIYFPWRGVVLYYMVIWLRGKTKNPKDHRFWSIFLLPIFRYPFLTYSHLSSQFCQCPSSFSSCSPSCFDQILPPALFICFQQLGRLFLFLFLKLTSSRISLVVPRNSVVSREAIDEIIRKVTIEASEQRLRKREMLNIQRFKEKTIKTSI